MDWARDRSSLAGEDHGRELGRRILLVEVVVADVAPRRERAKEILADKGWPDLDWNANQRDPVSSNQAAEVGDYFFGSVGHAMLEHFHARDYIIGAAVFGIFEVIDEAKSDLGMVGEAVAAILILAGIDIRADRSRKKIGHLSGEGPVAASVVEQTATSIGLHDLAGQEKAASMAPCDERAAREDLFLCVMSRLYVFRHHLYLQPESLSAVPALPDFRRIDLAWISRLATILFDYCFEARERVAMIESIAHQAESFARAAFGLGGIVEDFLDALRELVRVAGRIRPAGAAVDYGLP